MTARASRRHRAVAGNAVAKGAATVRPVRDPVSAAAATKAVALPAAHAPASGRARARQETRVAVAAPGAGAGLRRCSGDSAIAVITEPARSGDGWRHGFLGDTGMGKTWAMRELAQLPGALVLIHDDKRAQPEYPDVRYFRTTGELLAVPLAELEHLTAAGFRGDVYAGLTCEVDAVAALALELARAHVPCRLVVDELERATSSGGRELESDALRRCFTQGRAMNLSVLWGTQTPQRVPREALDQSSSVGIFRLGPRALNYLDERCFFDPAMLAAVERLERGEFVLWRNGHPWDRCVYRF